MSDAHSESTGQRTVPTDSSPDNAEMDLMDLGNEELEKYEDEDEDEEMPPLGPVDEQPVAPTPTHNNHSQFMSDAEYNDGIMPSLEDVDDQPITPAPTHGLSIGPNHLSVDQMLTQMSPNLAPTPHLNPPSTQQGNPGHMASISTSPPTAVGPQPSLPPGTALLHVYSGPPPHIHISIPGGAPAPPGGITMPISMDTFSQLNQLLAHVPITNEAAAFLEAIENPTSQYRPYVPFDPIRYVDSLPEPELSSIPSEDNKCPHCWLPFGETDEDSPFHVPEPPETEEIGRALAAFAEMPFNESKTSNDPVKTPCGHIFGRSCLIDSLSLVGTSCPMCRRELDSEQEERSSLAPMGIPMGDNGDDWSDDDEPHSPSDDEEGQLSILFPEYPLGF